MLRRFQPGMLLLPALMALVGCQRAPTTVGCQGNVTLDGKPLPEGVVVFEPVSATAGQIREAQIANGAFTLTNVEGLQVGSEYRVVIKGFRKTGRKYPAADPAMAYDEVEQYVPDMYNAKSKLRASFSADSAENIFEFNLLSRSR